MNGHNLGYVFAHLFIIYRKKSYTSSKLLITVYMIQNLK